MPNYKDYSYSNDGFAHTHAYLLQPILKVLNENKSRVILDIGCGNGWLTNHLISLGYNCYGTDASESGIKIAKEKNSDRFFVQDLEKNSLPEPLQTIKFDTIISTEVIEHLYSPRDYLQFCRRIFEKTGGGQLIITTPYHGYLKNVILSLSNKMDKHFTVLWDGGHVKFWSKKTLSEVLVENSFKVKQFIGCGRVPYVWKSMMIVSTYSDKKY